MRPGPNFVVNAAYLGSWNPWKGSSHGLTADESSQQASVKHQYWDYRDKQACPLWAPLQLSLVVPSYTLAEWCSPRGKPLPEDHVWLVPRSQNGCFHIQIRRGSENRQSPSRYQGWRGLVEILRTSGQIITQGFDGFLLLPGRQSEEEASLIPNAVSRLGEKKPWSPTSFSFGRILQQSNLDAW